MRRLSKLCNQKRCRKKKKSKNNRKISQNKKISKKMKLSKKKKNPRKMKLKMKVRHRMRNPRKKNINSLLTHTISNKRKIHKYLNFYLHYTSKKSKRKMKYRLLPFHLLQNMTFLGISSRETHNTGSTSLMHSLGWVVYSSSLRCLKLII